MYLPKLKPIAILIIALILGLSWRSAANAQLQPVTTTVLMQLSRDLCDSPIAQCKCCYVAPSHR